jgi:hypothetical protein
MVNANQGGAVSHMFHETGCRRTAAPRSDDLEATEILQDAPRRRAVRSCRRESERRGRRARYVSRLQHPPGGLIVGHGNSIHYAQCINHQGPG